MVTGRIEGGEARAIRRVIEFANQGTIDNKPVLDRQAQRLRQELIRDLVAVAEGTPLPEVCIRGLLDRARHLTITPHDFDANEGAVVFRFNYWNWAAISSYQTLVMYAARQNGNAFPGDLRRCRLESCGKFFFMSDLREAAAGGRPRSAYCCEAHMLKKHSTRSSERVARHRAKRRALRNAGQPSGQQYARRQCGSERPSELEAVPASSAVAGDPTCTAQ